MLTNDPQGRLVMWGWVQELGRPEGPHTYGSCLSLPRLLWRNPHDPSRLWQVGLALATLFVLFLSVYALRTFHAMGRHWPLWL